LMRNLTSTDRHRQNRAFRPMRNAAAMKWSLSSRPSPLQRGGRGCSRAACCRASRPITRRRAPTPIDPGARCGRDQMARADDGEANDAIARLAGSPHEPTVAWPADRHRRHAAPPISRSAAHRGHTAARRRGATEDRERDAGPHSDRDHLDLDSRVSPTMQSVAVVALDGLLGCQDTPPQHESAGQPS
jgi:hypothetical protein